MNKEQLIKSCNTIIQEIEARYWHFYICTHSNVDNVCNEIVPLLRKFGEENIEGFHVHIEDSGAFRYDDKCLPSTDEYNSSKIGHIKAFIKHIEEGGEY